MSREIELTFVDAVKNGRIVFTLNQLSQYEVDYIDKISAYNKVIKFPLLHHMRLSKSRASISTFEGWINFSKTNHSRYVPETARQVYYTDGRIGKITELVQKSFVSSLHFNCTSWLSNPAELLKLFTQKAKKKPCKLLQSMVSKEAANIWIGKVCQLSDDALFNKEISQRFLNEMCFLHDFISQQQPVIDFVLRTHCNLCDLTIDLVQQYSLSFSTCVQTYAESIICKHDRVHLCIFTCSLQESYQSKQDLEVHCWLDKQDNQRTSMLFSWCKVADLYEMHQLNLSPYEYMDLCFDKGEGNTFVYLTPYEDDHDFNPSLCQPHITS